jgi:hypothetical protein
MNIAEIIVPQQEVAWLPWAVQYFFLVGMAATAAILVAVGEFVRGGRWQRLQAPALVVAISTGVIAPIALLADLHQPGRFYHFYTDITPWSWMSLGALILPVFMTGLLGYWVLWQRAVFKAEGAPRWLALWAAGNWSGQALRPWIAGVMLIGALGILLYTGSEVMIVKARALWHTEWMIVNLALTAFMASLAAIVFTQARILAATPGGWLGGDWLDQWLGVIPGLSAPRRAVRLLADRVCPVGGRGRRAAAGGAVDAAHAPGDRAGMVAGATRTAGRMVIPLGRVDGRSERAEIRSRALSLSFTAGQRRAARHSGCIRSMACGVDDPAGNHRQSRRRPPQPINA